MTEVWTLGHSNHDPARFIELLMLYDITMVIDVRSSPWSRFAHFQRDRLIQLVRYNPDHKMDYRFAGNVLGGKANTLITAKLFIEKMEAILTMAADGEKVAMMCSEGKPWECHRAGKLCAWLHRERPNVKTTHILPDGFKLDGRECEPKIIKDVWWHEFESSPLPEAQLAIPAE